MRVRWNMQEADFVLAKDMATERLSANTKTTVAFSTLKVVIWTSCAAALLALTDAYRFGPGAGSTLVLAVSVVTAIAAYVASLNSWSKAAKQAQLRASGPFPIPYELEVCETGLRALGQEADTHIGWRGIGSVEELPHHLSITLRWGGIVLVPNDAFDTTERRKEFIDALRQGAKNVAPAA